MDPMLNEWALKNAHYPRPDFQRRHLSWKSLNGRWSFAFDDTDVGLSAGWHRLGIPSDIERAIDVPFVYQSPASGINELNDHQVVWYEKNIVIDSSDTSFNLNGSRQILRFGAVDYEATVWLDGQLIGQHQGGHVPFEFDVSGRLQAAVPSRLTVRIWDAILDWTQPRGK